MASAVITIDMDPFVRIGPLELAWHGLTTAIGIFVAVMIAMKYARQRQLDVEPLMNAMAWTILAGIVGARLLFLIETDPSALLEPSQWFGTQGFSFYGGLIVGGGAAAFIFRRTGVGIRYLDAIAVGFPLGMAVGRIGDLINGEHHGAVSELPWAIQYLHPDSEVPSAAVAFHPGGLYEILLALAIAGTIWAMRDRLNGQGVMLWSVLGLYSAGRFVMFFFRDDSPTVALGLNTSQWVSLGLLSVAAIGLWRASNPLLRGRRATSIVAVPLVAGSLMLLAGCFDDARQETASSPPDAGVASSQDPGLIHVHGLGIDPADGALFVASHTGLFKLPTGSRVPERIADRFQDTMAFTVVGPGRFLGSGHPDGREDLPPFLGLIESRDAGESWEEVSLMGEVDFHLLVADGKHIYGFGSEWEGKEAVFLASNDEGHSWEERPAPAPLIGLALSPDDPRRMVASTAERLIVSKDGGQSWEPVPGPPGLLVWAASDRIYLGDAEGVVRLSRDQGNSWETVGRLPDTPAALASGGGALLAATVGGMILESTDGAATWSVRFR